MTLKRAAKTGVATMGLIAAFTLNSMAWAMDHQATCRYFSNQAFQDRHGGLASTFRMQLAQDCVDARVYARSDRPEVKIRAEAYLKQLDAYRRVIAKMMIDRSRSPEARAPSRSTRRYTAPALASVSWPGAYLIARDMGLIETHQDWTAFRRTFTAADARLRID